MPSILRNNSRYRRDQRQPAEEEEMWFNEEDDFEDVPTDTKIAPDLDNSISKHKLKVKSIRQLILYSLDSGKITEKKSEMLNGPKMQNLLASHSPIQQQQPSTPIIVNSTNNNSRASNNNRKSSETVTSAPDEHEVGEQSLKPDGENKQDDLQTTTVAAQALAAALDEEPEPSLDESLSQVESQQPPFTTSSDTSSAETSKTDEKELKEEVLEVIVGKNEDDSVIIKKVNMEIR